MLGRTAAGRGTAAPIQGIALLAALTLALPIVVLVTRAVVDGSLVAMVGLRVRSMP